MTLENLAGIGKLKPHAATREEVAKLLAAANQRDAITARKLRKNPVQRGACLTAAGPAP